MSMRYKALARGVLLTLLALCAPAFGGRPQLIMLDQLLPGWWDMRDRTGAVVQRICITSGRNLIQLRHPGKTCESYILRDAPGEVEIQYTCRGYGYGRTHVRRETNRLVQIESQGIADGLPFEFGVEARRTGDCKPG